MIPRMKRNATLAVLVLALGAAGAAFKCNSTDEPVRHKIATWNNLLISANNTLSKTTESLNSYGLVDDATTHNILEATKKVAQIDNELLDVTDKTSNLTANDYAQISALLAEIKTSIATLVTNEAVGIKNETAKASVLAAVNGLTGVATTIIEEVEKFKASAAE